MRSAAVVLLHPLPGKLPDFVQAIKHIGIQNIPAICSVEPLDIPVLHRSSWLVYSGPLSTLIWFGAPRSSNSWLRVRITLRAGKEVSISIASPSLLWSSIIFSVRNFLPQVKLSLIKSMLQDSFTPFGTDNGSFILLGSLRLCLRFRFIFSFT